ncbi:phosphoribosylglycinamide formyltransferase [uncultured Tyzzerella sp.]|uniref:phosphoribosylglycinamide formyltransferase n=1 Tax=uncultured Tyzzerella sp. TaxID=2321398 RepID=UPI0029431A78|nr:phosphoribosylglycinamide formyltransferase [uncultured Tyzzerella sp.]
MFKIGVLVSGNGTNLQAIIDSINNGFIKNARIETVVTNKEDAFALQRAKNNNIETKIIKVKSFENKQLYEDALIDYLKEKELDLIVLAGFMVILSEKFVNSFKNKIINIHPSLIPAFSGEGYYGLKVHEGVLKRGCKITGATVHFVTEEADDGPIIIQKAVSVKDDDTEETLQQRVMEEAEWLILPEAINLILNKKIKIVDNIVRRIC